MDRKALLLEKIERMRAELPISDVAKDFMVLRRYGASFKGICPFHSDHSIGSFVITDSKGIWKCFSCGVGGDCIKFFALITNRDYYNGAIELGYLKGFINADEYEILSSYRISNKEKQKIEKIFIEKDREKFQSERAPIEVLDKVYRIFIKANEYLGKPKLSPEHYEHLKEKRKLSDEDIKRDMYFTFPTRHILKYFLKDLEENNIDLEELKKVPGFFYDKDKEAYSFMTVKGGGIGIPIIDEFGMVEAIQVRKDVVEVREGKESAKYIFFSSSFTINYDNLEGGVGCGSPIDVSFPECMINENSKGIPCRSIFITEGKFKAKQISKSFNSISLSVQGVTSWRNTLKCVDNIREIYKDRYVFDTIIIAYDADLGYNVGVLEQAIKTGLTYGGYSDYEVFRLTTAKKVNEINLLREKNIPNVYFALWDADDGKGIDDLIFNGHQCKIRKTSLEKMYNLYMPYKEAVYNLIENGTHKELKDIPISLMKEFFETMVLSTVVNM